MISSMFYSIWYLPANEKHTTNKNKEEKSYHNTINIKFAAYIAGYVDLSFRVCFYWGFFWVCLYVIFHCIHLTVCLFLAWNYRHCANKYTPSFYHIVFTSTRRLILLIFAAHSRHSSNVCNSSMSGTGKLRSVSVNERQYSLWKTYTKREFILLSQHKNCHTVMAAYICMWIENLVNSEYQYGNLFLLRSKEIEKKIYSSLFPISCSDLVLSI